MSTELRSGWRPGCVRSHTPRHAKATTASRGERSANASATIPGSGSTNRTPTGTNAYALSHIHI